MQTKLKMWELIFIPVIAFILGTLWHFLYDWLGKNPVLGAIFPVNESTWEHLKILFFPMLIVGMMEYYVAGYEWNGFIMAKALGILIGMISIIVIFYTYTGIVGQNYLWADITIFFIGIMLSSKVVVRLYAGFKQSPVLSDQLGFIIIAAFAVCFIIFTYYPPKIGLFLDPVTCTYGIL